MVILLIKQGNVPNKKEWITISLKKKLSFDELVIENRRQIMQDQLLMEKIEQNLESKREKFLKKVKK
ncbi:FbpB family small basic protein [Lentibacillus sp. L22]|uniref:FbpB family small basic protein n=1 Tax=Lentibacillus TaxID=175304 RepID=UPI0022B17614|nr:FbpB family small basic protein [Lentibacillus daqui]